MGVQVLKDIYNIRRSIGNELKVRFPLCDDKYIIVGYCLDEHHELLIILSQLSDINFYKEKKISPNLSQVKKENKLYCIKTFIKSIRYQFTKISNNSYDEERHSWKLIK